jgi:hypothetical protein
MREAQNGGQGRHPHTGTGTDQGDYMGIPPTGKAVMYNEIFISIVAADPLDGSLLLRG